MSASIDPLTSAVEASLATPLVATGSGGSLTVANFASWIHQEYAGRIAKAMTPLDLVSASAMLKDTTVLMLTARGGNPDIIGSFKHIVGREPLHLVVLCARSKSPLARVARFYRYVDLVEFDLPTGKDGFLATNSLLACVVMLSRAWSTALSIELDLPKEIGAFYPHSSLDDQLTDLARQCRPIWRRETITVLFGPSIHSVAVDLESRFTEAALGSVQSADYRNFAHGRHHWMAKRGKKTGVLAFITDDDRTIANKTLKLIPPEIPVARIEIPFGGLRANIAALITGMHLAADVGSVRGIDPGRPGVPDFGSKIYRLSGLGMVSRKSRRDTAIERKTGSTIELLALKGELPFWREAYETFVTRLQSQQFRGIVFDYDGTLCDGRDRYKGISDEVVENLTRLLRGRIIVGIATGRGKSVRDTLQSKLTKSLWSRVVIGYYNASDCGLLADDSHPDSTDCLCGDLRIVYDALITDPGVSQITKYVAEITCRRQQITIQMRQFAPLGLIKDAVQQVVHKINIPGVGVVYSTHSVDVIAPGVTKDKLVEEVARLAGDIRQPVLCIGDLGRWPGNDFALLSRDHSLSVDLVSPDPTTCWNIAPPGHRGVQGLMYYLACSNISNSSLVLKLTTGRN